MKVLIASGGTGGHLFPALALGEAFQAQQHEVVFVGSGRPLDRQVEASSGFKWRHIKSGRLKGMGVLNRLRALFILPYSCLQALGILIAEKPHCVIGVGGSSTGPMVLMARLLALQAVIFENNRIPGMTNRLLAPLVNRIFIALPVRPYFKAVKNKLRLSGNPIRRSIIQQFDRAIKNADHFTLLVLGGSQGAHALNQLMVDMIPHCHKELRERLQIIHVTGKTDCDWVSQSYSEAGLTHTKVLPFTDDLGLYYKQADLVLSRAGAATVGDLIRFGRASVLVPYPFAADQHQEANARYLADAGAAVMLLQPELNGADFAKQLQSWIKDRKVLETMGQKLHSLAPQSPAEEIVKECEELVIGHV